MNLLQFTLSTVLCILLGIQAVSHSQYYPHHPRNSDYDYYDSADEPLSTSATSDYLRRESTNPHELSSYREQRYDSQSHQNNYFRQQRGSTVQYFGTAVNNKAPEKTLFTTDNSGAEGWPSASRAAYMIRYNTPPTSSSASEESEYPTAPPYNIFQPPLPSSPPLSSPPYREDPPPPYFGSRKGINIFISNEDGFMSIYQPETNREVLRINTRGYQQPSKRPNIEISSGESSKTSGREYENKYDDDERPVYAMPTHECVKINKGSRSNLPRERDPNYRYYKENGKCYRPGSGLSPCGKLMMFYADDDDEIYGDCDCLWNNGYVSRPLAYWKPHNRCYLLYQKGPCRYNEWLILNRDGIPVCTPRKCQPTYKDGQVEDEKSQEFWFLYKGDCYRTGQYYSTFCGSADSKVYFDPTTNRPTCLKEPPDPSFVRSLVNPVNELRCQKGYKKMQNGNCKRIVKYDYGDYDY